MNDTGSSGLSPSHKEFLSEFEDLVEALNHDLLALDEVIAEGGEDPDLINSLFRSFHTIKGLAGMLSLDHIGTLAHALEDLLDAIRLGKVELSDELLQILFKGLELLNSHAKALVDGQEVEGQEGFLGLVRRAMEAKRETSPGQGMERIDIEDDIVKTLTEYEEHRLRENLKGNKNLFIVRRRFSLGDFDQALNDLVGLLKGEGEVISTLPSSPAEDPASIQFDLLWATLITADEARARMPLSEAQIIPLREERSRAVEKDKDAVSTTLRSLSETVRVDIKRLNHLMNIVGELVIYKTHLAEIARDFTAREGMSVTTLGLIKAVKSLERSLNFLQKGVIDARMVPIGQMFSKLHRVVRKVSTDQGKEVELKISGGDTELDKLVIEDMADPLLHLMRNAIDHGIEWPEQRAKAGKSPKGTVCLSASQKGNHIVIEIEDDGAGIDPEKIRKKALEKGLLERDVNYDHQQIMSVLFLPGFSTSERVTDVSGRGVGLDVVKNNVSRLRGMIDLESVPGKGTLVTITLPMTLAIIQALMVKVMDEMFAVPISSVLESVKINVDQIMKVENREVIRLREVILPLLRLDRFFGFNGDGGPRRGKFLYVVVVGLAEKRLGLVVDSLKGQQEIVIKTLGEMLKMVKGIAGATELGDRRAVLVLDVGALIQEVTHAI